MFNVRIKDKYDKKDNIVHIFSPIGKGYDTLCGHNTLYFSCLEDTYVEQTNDKVTCKDCLKIVNYCKELKI